MNNIRKVFTATGYHFYHSITNPKVWAAFLLLFTMQFQDFIGNSEAAYGLSVFSSLFNRGEVLLFLSLIMIISELPFDDPQQTMLITRTGKRCWYMSQMLYVALECLLVVFFLTLATFIFKFSRIDPTLEIEEFQWCYPIGICVLIVYGSLIFVLNTLKRYVGTIFGAVLIALRFFQVWILGKEIKMVSMLGWCSYYTINSMGDSVDLGKTFVITALIVLYAAAIALAVFNSRKKKDLNM